MAETKIRIESIRTWPGRRVPLPPAHPEPLLLTDDGFLEIDWEREIAPGGVEAARGLPCASCVTSISTTRQR